MESELIIEYVFKGTITLAVSAVIYILKDFKASMTKLTDSLTEVTLSLNTLIQQHVGLVLVELGGFILGDRGSTKPDSCLWITGGLIVE